MSSEKWFNFSWIAFDRAIDPSLAFASFREQPMHFNDNQTLSLRVVDPIEDDGV